MSGWIARKTWHLKRDIDQAGIRLTASFHLRCLIRGVLSHFFRNPNPTLRLRVPGVKGLVRARWGSSDISVFHSVFLSGHYRPLCEVPTAGSIVDCGANVGYSAIYLLRQFPDARLVAIEPAPDNADLCRANLSSFGVRATVMEAAAWPAASGGLVLDRGTWGRVEPWAIQVREIDANQASDVAAVTISEVMEKFGFASIDILKIDIEGSEQKLFQRGATAWLGHVKNLAVELHDDGSRQTFSEAMSTYEYHPKQAGQLTFCFNLRVLAQA